MWYPSVGWTTTQPALGYHITNSQSRYITPTSLKAAHYSLHNNAPSSHKLLKMDVLTSETCWAVNWHNKASVIKLVYIYSNIKMMHGPICIRITNVCGTAHLANQLRTCSQVISAQRWISAYRDLKKTRKFYTWESFRTIKAAGTIYVCVCVCVCCGGTSGDSTTIKGLFSVTSIWRTFLAVSTRTPSTLYSPLMKEDHYKNAYRCVTKNCAWLS